MRMQKEGQGSRGTSRAVRGVAAPLLSLLCLSCTTFVPQERGTDFLPVPDAFTLYELAAPVPVRWWTAFQSEELTRLVDEALGGNLSLQQMYARLRQAELLAREAGALRWPELELGADASVTRRHTDTGASYSDLEVAIEKLNALNTLAGSASGTPATTKLEALSDALRAAQSKVQALDTLLAGPPSSQMTATTRSYGFGLGTSYEVDLWGRVQAQHEAARLNYEASREDVYAAMLSLSGAVVLQWLTIVAVEQEFGLVQEQLELNRTVLELMELRYHKGMATALDVYQQRQIVAQTESLIPPIESELQTARHELAVLLGKPPRAEQAIDTKVLPGTTPLPEPGLPADLLARRPDVRAFGLQLRAADWQVSAARAARLPALRLTASASYGADEWDLVFDNWMATLAGSLTGPIFDAGRRKAEVARTRAVVDERLAAYRERVLEAVLEVENSLVQETKQCEYIEALRRELDAARASHDQALERYRKGLNDYLPVLSALMELQVLERRLVQAEFTRLVRRVQLCVALGGAWMEEELVKSGE